MEHLPDTRCLIQGLSQRCIRLQGNETCIGIFNCEYTRLIIPRNVNKIIIGYCKNLIINCKRLYSGIEIVHCELIHIETEYSPIFQIDNSKFIIGEINTESGIVQVYYTTSHTIFIKVQDQAFRLWDDFFSRQILSEIDMNEMAINTRAISF